MAFFRISQRIEDLNQDIRAYVQNKLEYFELKMIKKLTEIWAKALTRIFAVLAFSLFLIFISMAAAIVIGRYYGDLGLGFLIVSGVYFLAFIIVLIFGKRMFSSAIVRRLSKAILKKKKNSGNT